MKIKSLFLQTSLVFLMTLACVTLSYAKILIIAPHPDDEALMFSGIIYGALSRGEAVKVVLLTNGDISGVAVGNTRQDETISAMVNSLGMHESNIIFVGYPDGGLTPMYKYYLSSSAAYVAPNGQSTTYGHRGLGSTDYHYYKFGNHASYNKPNIFTDLKSIINDFQPGTIFVTSQYDLHPDHSIAHSIIVEVLSDISIDNPSYKPIIHKTIIHGGSDSSWPATKNPATPFTSPPTLNDTPLSWNNRESINLPFIMQSDTLSNNLKYNTILKYSSQLNYYPSPQDNYLTNFTHKDEIFWAENIYGSNSPPVANGGNDQAVNEGTTVFLDGSSSIDPDGASLSYQWVQLQGTSVTLSDSTSQAPAFTAPTGISATQTLVFQLTVSDGQLSSFPDTVAVTVIAASQYADIASSASATASSQNTSTGQLATKAIDGVIGGCPGNCTAEWATVGQLAGAWLSLSWPQSYIVDKIVLFDMPNLNEQILNATLSFSDNTSIIIGPLANSGSKEVFSFPAKKTNSVKLTVNQANGSNIGLAEIQVFGVLSPTLAVTTTSPPSGTTGTSYSQVISATGGLPPYTWSITSGTLPSGLSLSASSGTISGTPTATGSKTFTIQARDASLTSVTKSLSITISTKPAISTTSLSAGALSSNYSQTLAATGGQTPYTWSISSGSLPAGLALNPSSGTISGIPTTTGTSTFTAQVKDANRTAATKALSIAIEQYDPVISTSSLDPGFTGSPYSGTLAATGGQTPYTWSITSGTLPAGLTLNTSSGAISGTPTAAGTSSFTVQVKDANQATASKSLAITITSTGSVLFTDDFTRSPPVSLSPWTSFMGTWEVVSGILNGSGTAMTYSHIYYAPNPLWDNYAVEGRFKYASSAFGGGIGCRLNPATGAHYAAWIYPDNSEAGSNLLVMGKMWGWTTYSGTPMAQVKLTSVGTGWHTLKMVCNGNRIQVYYDGTLKIDVTDNNYDSRAPYLSGGVGMAMFTVNNVNTMSVDNVVVSSLNTNLAPVAVNDSYNTIQNTGLTTAAPGVLSNDTDPEGAALTAQLVTAPSHGTLTLNSNGSFTYTPTAGYVGSDSFTYRASDGTLTSGNATVTITISGVNQPPVASNDSYSTIQNTILTPAAPGVLSNDTDPEGAALTAQLVTAPSHGTLTLNSNGSFTYTPTAGYVGSDSFTYRASDGTLTSGNATVIITISGVNQPPVASNDSYSTIQNTILTPAAPGVLSNDTDPEGAALTAQLVTAPSHGTLTLNSNGSFTYTPTTGYVGSDSFTYRASDGTLYSGNATVIITITSTGSVLFADDFTRSVNPPAPLSPWTSFMGTWEVASGVLNGSGAVSSYSHIYHAPDPLWENYSVEARLRYASTAFGGGIGCRLNPATGAHYTAWIYPDNSVAGSNVLALGKMWSWTTYGGTPMGLVNLPSVGTGWHTLKMVCNGNRIQVYYDGTLKIDVTDNNYDSRAAYLSGGIDMAMYTLNNVNTMSVDNVVVNTLSP